MHLDSSLKKDVMKTKCCKNGKPMSKQAAHQALKCKKDKILKLLVEVGDGDEEVQIFVLFKVLLDPSMDHVSKSVLTETFNSEDWQNQSVQLEASKNDQSGPINQSTKDQKS